jgi:hypothetical protein
MRKRGGDGIGDSPAVHQFCAPILLTLDVAMCQSNHNKQDGFAAKMLAEVMRQGSQFRAR